jgi:hypothetical protein
VELDLGTPLPPVEATATLAHKFDITGEPPCLLVPRLFVSACALVCLISAICLNSSDGCIATARNREHKINFDKTTVNTKGNLARLPLLELLRLPDNLRPPTSNTGERRVV